MRAFQFRLANDPGEAAIQVLVRDQSGELKVAVRTADGNLAQTLGEHLPELVHRLGQQGFEMQTWRPGGSPASPADQTMKDPASDKPELQSGGRRESDSGGEQDAQGGRRGSGNSDDPRRWRDRWNESVEAAQ
jgi:hypothetical protein